MDLHSKTTRQLLSIATDRTQDKATRKEATELATQRTKQTNRRKRVECRAAGKVVTVAPSLDAIRAGL